MAKQSIYPFPVYVATFGDGTTGRLSFWSAQGKPMNFERGRAAVAICYARPDHVTGMRAMARAWPPAVIVAGHVEWNGETIADPHFAPHQAAKIVRPSWRDVAARAKAALEAGDTAAALSLLHAA